MLCFGNIIMGLLLLAIQSFDFLFEFTIKAHSWPLDNPAFRKMMEEARSNGTPFAIYKNEKIVLVDSYPARQRGGTAVANKTQPHLVKPIFK